MTARRSGASLGWLLRGQGDGPEHTFRILPGHERTIGRARSVDFVLDAPLVSRVHCRLTAHPAGRLDVEDLKSTNGTFVNGQRITRATLTVGDQLTIGRVELTVEKQ